MDNEIDITKLPKKIQQRINDLQRERDVAVRALNEYLDNQTPSHFYFDDLLSTGEERGPSPKRVYVQAGSHITIEHAGVTLEVYDCYGERLSLRWHSENRHREIALIPETYMAARLVAKENMD